MPGYIEKGKVTNINGNIARVVPCSNTTLISDHITIPINLMDKISKGTEVIYTLFDDHSGIIIMKSDGS